MAVSNYVAILRIASTNLFNGIIIIPTILALTLVMEVDASEDYSPIVPTTYDGSVLDTEGQTIFTNNRSDRMTDTNTSSDPYQCVLYWNWDWQLSAAEEAECDNLLSGNSTDDDTDDTDDIDEIDDTTTIVDDETIQTCGDSSNVCLGNEALSSLSLTALNNTAIGHQAGFSNINGEGNVFLGHQAGYDETGSNQLYISNSKDNDLITGDFITGFVNIGRPGLSEGGLGVYGRQGLRLYTDDGSNYISLLSPFSLSENLSYTFPGLDGNNGQVLTTNGNGGLSWASVSSDSGVDTNTTNSSMSLSGTTLTLTDSASNNLTADLSSIDTNTTNSSMSLSGSTLTLTDSSNDTVSADLSSFITIDTNTTNSSMSLSGNTLTLTDSASNNLTADLSSLSGSSNIDGLSDAKSEGTDFSGSLLIGHQTTGTLDAAENNTGVGIGALDALTTGDYNTALGNQALTTNTSGNNNTAMGYQALYSNTTGYNNIALGFHALYSNTTGYQNIAMGHEALYANTTGINNTALGIRALFSNTTGKDNTAVGYRALYSNTTTNNNTALGYEALYNNVGRDNTASGYQALNRNTTGFNNTAMGIQALYANTTGNDNTAMGLSALLNNTTGENNTAMGSGAGRNNQTGSENVFIGYKAGFNETGSNKLYIANDDGDGDRLIYGDFSTGNMTIGNGSGTIDFSAGTVNTEEMRIGGERAVTTSYVDGAVSYIESIVGVSSETSTWAETSKTLLANRGSNDDSSSSSKQISTEQSPGCGSDIVSLGGCDRDQSMLFGNRSTGDMSLGMTGMGTVSVMNNLAVMGTSLTVNGKEVATQEYVDNKFNQVTAYQSSVSADSNPVLDSNYSVAEEMPMASNNESNAIVLNPMDTVKQDPREGWVTENNTAAEMVSNNKSNAITMDPNDSSLSKKDQMKEEVIKSDGANDYDRIYDGGSRSKMVSNQDGKESDTTVAIDLDGDLGNSANKEYTYIGSTAVASNGYSDTSDYRFRSSTYLQEQVATIERNTAKLTEHSALIQGNTMSILSNTSLIQETRNELYGGLAMSAALSTPELFVQRGFNITAGTGYYGGRSALSFSANYVTDRVMYSFGYAHAHGAEKMARAGVSFHLGKRRQ